MISLSAQPEAIDLSLAHTALIIIDMQRDFLEPGGFGASLGNDVSLLRSAIAPCQALLSAARALGMLVIHTREGHLPDLSDAPPAKIMRGKPELRIGSSGPMGRVLVRGEPGHAIIPELAPIAGEIIIDKPGKGSFYATDLEMILHLRGISNIILTGITTDVCVHTTMREANDRGFECVLLADCCAATDPENHKAALAMIHMQGGV